MWPIAGVVQRWQRVLGFPSWLAGLVWLVKPEDAVHFLLHLSAPECRAVAPARDPYSAGKSGSRTLALDLASCWGPLRWPHGDGAG